MAQNESNIDLDWFTRNGFFSREVFAAEAMKYLKGSCVGIFIAILANLSPQTLHPAYLGKAMAQSLGPELWNFIGATGLIGLGLFVLFPNRRFFASTAVVLLETAYSVGTLMTGVFAGWFLICAPQALAGHGFLWTLFSGAVAMIAVAMCALMNYFVWYLSWLLRGDMTLMTWLTGLKAVLRCAIGGFLVLMPILTYLFQ